MAFLHNGSLLPTTVFSFYPCNVDSIFLAGMREGDTLISIRPEFFQNANGYVAIDDRFTSLQVMRDGIAVQILNLTWHTDCVSQVLDTSDPPFVSDRNTYGFGWILVIGAGVLTIAILRRFFNGNR
jgi:hypothetical protein